MLRIAVRWLGRTCHQSWDLPFAFLDPAVVLVAVLVLTTYQNMAFSIPWSIRIIHGELHPRVGDLTEEICFHGLVYFHPPRSPMRLATLFEGRVAQVEL